MGQVVVLHAAVDVESDQFTQISTKQGPSQEGELWVRLLLAFLFQVLFENSPVLAMQMTVKSFLYRTGIVGLKDLSGMDTVHSGA